MYERLILVERRSRKLWWPIEFRCFPLCESWLSQFVVTSLIRNMVLIVAELIEWLSLLMVQGYRWFCASISFSFILNIKKEFGPPISCSPSFATILYFNNISLNFRFIVVLFFGYNLFLLLHRILRRECSSIAIDKELSHLSLK